MTEFIRKRVKNVKNDVLSGITVALALVPEAVAFAFVAGVDPLVGLYAAFMVGLITSIFGGRPGMISGATGALAVVMVSLVSEGNAMGNPDENLGLYYLFATVILMGLIQISAGVFKLGKFVRLIPHPVMMGFVNGLAIVIFLSQLGMFKTTVDGEKVWLEGNSLWYMIGLVLLTMLIMWGLPKIKATKKLPEALIGILVVTGIVIFSNLDVATVGSFIRDGGGEGLKGGLPSLHLETFSKIPMNFETLKFIFPYALILAAIGLIESLMTLNLIDDLTETRGNSNKECVFTSYPLISDTNYLQTVTVLSENQIQIRIYTPSYNTINGYNIFRSDNNGSSFIFIGYANNTGNPIVFNDNNVFANEQTYIYKAIAVDSCNNITNKESNIGNSILLTTVSNSGDYKINLDWSDYQKWNGDVKEFQIFRKLGINPPVLIASVPFNTYSYQDDISAFYSSSDDGKFCYYIEAVENVNQFGFSETSKSNISCTSPDYLIYIPNTFTPNDDGLNDEFLPIIGFANYNKYTFRVFNRIGSEIFITTDINEGWDGKHKNKNVPVGVYVYNILIEDSQGTPIQKNGTILILK